MTNRNNRMYVNGTAALKIRDNHETNSNVVCLGRSRDGRLVVEDTRQTSRPVASQRQQGVVQPQTPSLRNDALVAFNALGLSGMKNNFMNGSAVGKAFPKADRALGVLFGAAVFFAALALVLM